MKDNRIIRSEQMTNKDHGVMKEAVKSVTNKFYRCKSEEEREQERRNNPNYVFVNGKWYDKRYMK